MQASEIKVGEVYRTAVDLRAGRMLIPAGQFVRVVERVGNDRWLVILPAGKGSIIVGSHQLTQ